MIDSLRTALNQYVNREIDLGAFEDWVISHLQAILDSHDQPSIDIAQNLDARFIELGEDLITEDEFFNEAQSLLPPPVTLPVVGLIGVTVMDALTVRSTFDTVEPSTPRAVLA